MSEHHSQPEPGRLDRFLKALADYDRRIILDHLRAMPESTTTLGDLVDVLMTHEEGDREQARMRLHHTHLPTLADTHILEYDAHSSTVRYHGDDTLEALLRAIQQAEPETDPTEP